MPRPGWLLIGIAAATVCMTACTWPAVMPLWLMLAAFVLLLEAGERAWAR